MMQQIKIDEVLETENRILKVQIERMYKELANKDEEIRKLNMQLEERKFVLDSVLARVTLKE